MMTYPLPHLWSSSLTIRDPLHFRRLPFFSILAIRWTKIGATSMTSMSLKWIFIMEAKPFQKMFTSRYKICTLRLQTLSENSHYKMKTTWGTKWSTSLITITIPLLLLNRNSSVIFLKSASGPEIKTVQEPSKIFLKLVNNIQKS